MKFFNSVNKAIYLIAALMTSIGYAQGYEQQNDSEQQNNSEQIIEIGGIGAVIYAGEYGYQIEDVLPGSPAAAAGLVAGDYIYAVDGYETASWSFDQTIFAIRGEIGTSVSLTIRRSGVELIVLIVRESLGL